MSNANIENNPRVTILLLNYNGWDDAIECLESVYKITYPNWEVILVDNGSEDDSVSRIKEWAAGKIQVESNFFGYDAERKPIEYIEELFYDEEEKRVTVSKRVKEWDALPPYQKLSILRIEKNRGFTGGNNIGIEYILSERKTDYILLLNNDTIVDKEFLGELVKIGESNPKIGIVGSVNYYYDNPKRIWYSGGVINWVTGKLRDITCNKIDQGQFDKIREVDDVAGSSLLIKVEVINRIGLLYADYFCTYEETEWCTKTKKKGYLVYTNLNSKIWHKVGSATTKKIRGFDIYYLTRNRLVFMRRNANKLQFISFLFYFFLLDFILTTGSLLVLHKDLELLKTYYRAIYDGIRLSLKRDL